MAEAVIMSEPDVRAWYCKAKKKTGKPVEVQMKGQKNPSSRRGFSAKGCLRVSMKYNNAHARARKSGATTVLEVRKLPKNKCK